MMFLCSRFVGTQALARTRICLYTGFWRCKSIDPPKRVVIRRALFDDKQEVLSMRKDLVSSKMDYLESNFDFYVQDNKRYCFVGELDRKIVSFIVLKAIDGGKNVFAHSLIVQEQFEGQGVVVKIRDYIDRRSREMGFDRLYMLADSSQKATRTESFKRKWTKEHTKIQYMIWLARFSRQLFNVNENRSDMMRDAIKPVTYTEMTCLFEDSQLRAHLFSSNRMSVNFISYECIADNIHLLSERNTRFYSNVCRRNDGKIHGLLSAGSWFFNKYASPQFLCYVVDLFGYDAEDLEEHIVFHINEALYLTGSDISFHIIVEKGDMAERLQHVLSRLRKPGNDISAIENNVFYFNLC